MSVTKTTYSSSATFNCSFSSLGSDAARGSLAIDNSSNLYLDALVRVTVSVGTVSSEKRVLVYAYGSEDGTLYPDTVTGSDDPVTLESPTVLQLACVIPTPSNSKVYESDAFSIARLYGGILPRKWGIVIHNRTGATLASTNNSSSYTGITLTTS